MPAARVSPAGLTMQQDRSSFRSSSSHQTANQQISCKRGKVFREDENARRKKKQEKSLNNSIKQEKGTWLAFAKRFHEWSAAHQQHIRDIPRSDLFRREDSYGDEMNAWRGEKFPDDIDGTKQSQSSSNQTWSKNNTSTDTDGGSSGSLQFIHSSNCIPSTAPNGHPSSEVRRAKSPATAYQKTVRRLAEDDRWRREITLGHRVGFYRIKGDVGSGNFSQVKFGIHSLTNEKVAIKILDKNKLDSKTQRMLNREIHSMERLHHPHLVRLFEVIETFSKIHLVMEYAAEGELYQKITNCGKLNEPFAKRLFAQIASAVDHMHRHHIIHRDIKAENVFFSNPETVKVGDFGFSTEITRQEELLSTYCGSPPYAAPELFESNGYVGSKVDIWSLGILLYFMVTGQMPFKSQTLSVLKQLITSAEFTIPDYVSIECSWLIRSCLQRLPENRPEMKDIQEEKWLKGQTFPGSLPKYRLTQAMSQSLERVNDSIVKEVDTRIEEEMDGKTGKEPSTKQSVSSEGVFSLQEEEAMECLKNLGINEEMIIANQFKGVRSNIIGTFRIILHQIITKSHNKSELGEIEPRESNDAVEEIRNSSSNGNVSLRNDDEPERTEKALRNRKTSNSMKMPTIFTDSEGYITLPRDQTKNLTSPTTAKANTEMNGISELNGLQRRSLDKKLHSDDDLSREFTQKKRKTGCCCII